MQPKTIGIMSLEYETHARKHPRQFPACHALLLIPGPGNHMLSILRHATLLQVNKGSFLMAVLSRSVHDSYISKEI